MRKLLLFLHCMVFTTLLGQGPLPPTNLQAQITSTGRTTTSIEAYGAKCDARTVIDGGISSGSPNLAATTSTPFAATDVGKIITVSGAGAAGGTLLTTISTFTNSGNVVLAANAGTTVTAGTGSNVVPSSGVVTFGTNDQAAAQAALNALPNGTKMNNLSIGQSGGRVELPPRGCLMGSALTLPSVNGVSLVGAGWNTSTLIFTGATHGIVFPDFEGRSHGDSIGGFTIATTNSAALDGIHLGTAGDTYSHGYITGRDIAWNFIGRGQWTRAFYINSIQSSSFYNLLFGDFSFKTALSCNDTCNGVRFYGTEIEGGSGSGDGVLMGIEITNPAPTNDVFFYSGVIQGYFNVGLIAGIGGGRFDGFHFEATNASPSQGADVIWYGGGTEPAAFSNLVGGSFLLPPTGPATLLQNFSIRDSAAGPITATGYLRSSVFSNIIGSYTDAGRYNTWENITSGAGVQTTRPLASQAAPTLSGFGTSPSVVASNGTGAFRINVGTGGSASSGTITLPQVLTGWNCSVTNITTTSTTVFITKQTASSTTTATIGNFSTAGVAAAWVASDILAVSCFAY